MKVFVGTMECGEADFSDCVAAIKSQKNVDVIHHQVFSNLPVLEAHQELFKAWNAIKSEFDLFLKVDADTILMHDYIISDHVMLFKLQPRLTWIQSLLYDYMTDSLINGLNCIRNTVKVKIPTNNLFPERVYSGHDITAKSDDLPISMLPSGRHGTKFHDIHAFHYGLFRALKGQSETIQKVTDAYNKSGGRARRIAMLGFNAANKFRNSNNKFNYNDPEFIEAFNEAMRNFNG